VEQFNNNIHDNTIINHDCALEFFLSSNNTITANVIQNCKAGLQLGKSFFNNFTENNVSSCKYAVSLYAGSSNNTFYYNNFISNQVHVFETHQQTLLSASESYSVGNTWV
jgi:parallel beta-helix repeat protein